MAEFKVVNIIDGDTFEVSPLWRWSGQTGSHVRPTGYDVPEMTTLVGQLAKDKLFNLINEESVTLGSAYRIDRGRLVCDAFFKGRNLADYFQKYK
jgi:hypothetical protein